MYLMFNVTNIVTILFLIFLEGLLSMDNALVLAMLVRHLPSADRRKALTYGVWGAFIFRALAVFFLTRLLHLGWIKIAGGVYLLYVAIRETLSNPDPLPNGPAPRSGWQRLWRIILLVELMDLAFSADSILAAVSVSQNFWIVLTGGVLGILMMRFAAQAFCWLMERFPRLEATAVLLIATIGLRLCFQGMETLESWLPPAFDWIFRAGFLASIIYGFGYKRPGVIAREGV